MTMRLSEIMEQSRKKKRKALLTVQFFHHSSGNPTKTTIQESLIGLIEERYVVDGCNERLIYVHEIVERQ